MIHLMKIIGRRTGTMLKPNMDMVKKYVSETYTEAKNTGYMLTSTRDNDDDCAIYFYDNAVEAVNAFNRYVDWGFAKDFLTIRLYEPTGNINQKVLKRATGGDCTFVREDYSRASDILAALEAGTKKDEAIRDFALLFSKDNIRFDIKRFATNAGASKELLEELCRG
jgi:hypothetical protein